MSTAPQSVVMSVQQFCEWSSIGRTKVYEEIATLDVGEANARLQEIYSVAIDPELVRQRVQEMREAGATVAGALSHGLV